MPDLRTNFLHHQWTVTSKSCKQSTSGKLLALCCTGISAQDLNGWTEEQHSSMKSYRDENIKVICWRLCKDFILVAFPKWFVNYGHLHELGKRLARHYSEQLMKQLGMQVVSNFHKLENNQTSSQQPNHTSTFADTY